MSVFLTAAGAYWPGELAPLFREVVGAGKVEQVRPRVLRTSAAVVSMITTFVACGTVLTACGSDDNRAASTAAVSGVAAGTAPCGGKNKLTAEGSTTQQNAISSFNHVWDQSCPGKDVSYNPTGSGAGRTQFVAGHVDFAGSESP